MLLLRVDFYASLRKISNSKTVEFLLPDRSTVQWLLESVITRYPDMRDKLLNHNGELDQHAHIIVNGRSCPLLENGLATNIAPNDTVSFFPIGHF